MADATATATDEKKELKVPAEVQEKFPELVEMIKASGSMDDDERQYWVDVLPIMSEGQVENLRGILDNEKKRLADAAKEYSEGMEGAVDKATKAFDEAAYLEKKRAREAAEKKQEAEEKASEAAVLKELENL
jgi:hypothetical protein